MGGACSSIGCCGCCSCCSKDVVTGSVVNGKHTYTVKTTTASKFGSGTNAIISFYIQGSKGRTKTRQLEPFGTDRGETHEQTYHDLGDVGEVYMICFWYTVRGIDFQWFCEHVTVSTEDETYEFPWDGLLGDSHVYLFCNNASLPNDDSVPGRNKARMQVLADMKQHYEWTVWSISTDVKPSKFGIQSWNFPGMPPTIKNVPTWDAFQVDLNLDYAPGIVKYLKNTKVVANFLDAVRKDWDDFDDINQVYNCLDENAPAIADADRWRSDVEFGRQRMNGMNPWWLKKCTKIPSGFKVTDELVAPVMGGSGSASAASGSASEEQESISDDDEAPEAPSVRLSSEGANLKRLLDLSEQNESVSRSAASASRSAATSAAASGTASASDDEADGLNPNGVLKKAMKAGRLFIVDYKNIDGVEMKKDRCTPAAFCLLWVNDDGDLVPVAIQLSRGKKARVFTPKDSEYDWIFAKMGVGCSELTQHEAFAHGVCSHFVTEVFAIAANRNLSRAHPIYQLLSPHFKYLIAANASFRSGIVAPNMVVDVIFGSTVPGFTEVMVRSTKEWNVFDASPVRDTKKRGVGELKNNFYRDDALSVWECIKTYVSDILGHHYKEEDDLNGDLEVNAWLRDVRDHFPSAGVPEDPTRADIAEICCILLFLCTSGHSAVNYSQYDFSYVPNLPACLNYIEGVESLEQLERVKWTEAKLMKCLPTREVAAWQSGFLHFLSTPPYKFLVDYSGYAFGGSDDIKRAAKFQKDLVKVSKNIKARNKKSEKNGILPYTYVDPAAAGISIAI